VGGVVGVVVWCGGYGVCGGMGGCVGVGGVVVWRVCGSVCVWGWVVLCVWEWDGSGV
jgi:hypothetical protein